MGAVSAITGGSGGGVGSVISSGGLAGSSGLLGGITGEDAAEAARRGAELQAQAGLAAVEEQRAAREESRELLAPFTQFGMGALPGLQGFMQDPTGFNFLQANPMFEAALERSEGQLANIAAAQGRAGSGGLREQLFQNYLAQGEQFINPAFNRLLSGVGIGQASAAGQSANIGQSAANIGNLLTDIGAVRAGGVMGASNAQQQGIGNLMNLAATGAGLFAFSDERLKEDVEVVGKDGELDIIEFKYKDVEGRYRGYRAHQVYEHDPESVKINDSGYLMVDAKYAPERIS